MSQGLTVIPTVGTLPGLSLVNLTNAALDALLTNNSGASAPPQAPVGYQFWADTTAKNLKMYLGSSFVPKMNVNTYTNLAKTANHTVVAADYGVLIDCTANTFTLTLTAAGTLGDGFWFMVVNSGTGVITIDPNGAETIDGVASITILPGQSALIQCNSVSWKTLGRQRVWPVTTKTGAYTVVASDLRACIQATSGTWTLTLTAAATLGNGFIFIIQNVGSGVVTIDPNGAETINGVSTLAVGTGETRYCLCDGAGWRTVASDGINALSRPVRADKTGNYTVVLADRGAVIPFSGLGADATLTLPSAASAGDGFSITIINKMDTAGGSTNRKVIIDGNASETIDGLTTRDVWEGVKVTISCDGTDWTTVDGTYRYFSGDVTIAAAASNTLAHGLGRRPTRIWTELLCVTGEQGWSANDIMPHALFASDSVTTFDLGFDPDATNLNLRQPASALWNIPNKTTGASVSITTANWRVRVYAEE